MKPPQPQNRENRPAPANAAVVALLANLLKAAERGEIGDFAAVVIDPRGRFAQAVCLRPESLPVLLVGLTDLGWELQTTAEHIFRPPTPRPAADDGPDDFDDAS